MCRLFVAISKPCGSCSNHAAELMVKKATSTGLGFFFCCFLQGKKLNEKPSTKKRRTKTERKRKLHLENKQPIYFLCVTDLDTEIPPHRRRFTSTRVLGIEKFFRSLCLLSFLWVWKESNPRTPSSHIDKSQ